MDPLTGVLVYASGMATLYLYTLYKFFALKAENEQKTK